MTWWGVLEDLLGQARAVPGGHDSAIGASGVGHLHLLVLTGTGVGRGLIWQWFWKVSFPLSPCQYVETGDSTGLNMDQAAEPPLGGVQVLELVASREG